MNVTREALAEALFDALGWSGSFRYHPEDEREVGDYRTYRSIPTGIERGDIDHDDWRALVDRISAALGDSPSAAPSLCPDCGLTTDHWPLASATPSPRPTAEGLDVERLARALNAAVGRGWIRANPSDAVAEWRENARAIVAEYARLSEPAAKSEREP